MVSEMAVVMVVVAAALSVVMTFAVAMPVTVYGPLVDASIVRLKIMNVAVFVVLRLACTYDVGRYVILVLTVPCGTVQK